MYLFGWDNVEIVKAPLLRRDRKKILLNAERRKYFNADLGGPLWKLRRLKASPD